MQPIFQAISTFFKKLGGRPVDDLQNAHDLKRIRKKTAQTAAHPPQPAVQLSTLNEEQLRRAIPELSERALIRQLQAMDDPALQAKVIQCIDSESTLKRILRSELNKKLKKAAESRLQETEGSSARKRLQYVSKLCDELDAFLKNPDWKKGPTLLASLGVHTSELEVGSRASGLSHSLSDRFFSLKNRLESGLTSFEKTLAEMAEIAERLSPKMQLSSSEVKRLKDRWQELSERYAFDQELPVFTTYRDHVRLRAEGRNKGDRAAQRPNQQSQVDQPAPSLQAIEKPPSALPQLVSTEQASTTTHSTPPQNSISESESRKSSQRDKKREASLSERRALLEEIQRELEGIERNLSARQAGDRLKERQKQLSQLDRWKNEFPEVLEELKSRVRGLLIKRTHQLSEAQWDLWARTDQASRILQTLQARLDLLEKEEDPKKRVLDSRGLGQLILTSLSDLKALGHLDREKDHQIWEEFKAQTERGWRFCEAQRQQILDAFRATLLETLQTPKELTLQSIQEPSFALDFKPEAFQEDVATLVKELRILWTEVGARRSQSNLDADLLFTRLFERYFRAFNLHHGQIQRTQLQLEMEKKGKLEEVRGLLHADLTLGEKVRKAVQISQSWANSPFPEEQRQTLQQEFATEMTRLTDTLGAKIAEQLKATEIALQSAAENSVGRAPQELSELSLASSDQSLFRATLEDLNQKKVDLDSQIQSLPKILKIRSELPSASLSNLPFDESTLQETRQKLLSAIESLESTLRVAAQDRRRARDQILAEAERLAISTDREQAQARFAELKELWKAAGILQTPEDPSYTLLFENAEAFLRARFDAKVANPEDAKVKNQEDAKVSLRDAQATLQTQKSLLFRLDALARFRETQKGETPHFSSLDQIFKDEAPSQVTSKVLEAGLSYRSILSMEPKTALLKETKKLMDEWIRVGSPNDSEIPLLYRAYLERLHWIFGIKQAE